MSIPAISEMPYRSRLFNREGALLRWRLPFPLVGQGGSARSAEPDEGCWKKLGLEKSNDFSWLCFKCRDPSSTPHPTELRSATFSHKGRRGHHLSAPPANAFHVLVIRPGAASLAAT
jgi:hypothetical protein